MQVKVALAGNIGNSFAELVVKIPMNITYWKLAVSIDDVVSFKPYIAILLNITPDHLDQYDYKLNVMPIEI